MPRARLTTPRGRRSNPRSRGKANGCVKDESIYVERNFINPNLVSQHLLCPICQEPFDNPHRAPCGHSFCKKCIDPWLEKNSICPLDRRHLPRGSLHHDFIVENVIGDYMVACPWRSLGCEFIGPLHSLLSHKKGCSMDPSSFPPALRDRFLIQKQNNQNNVYKPSTLIRLDSMGSTQTSTPSASADSGLGSLPSASTLLNSPSESDGTGNDDAASDSNVVIELPDDSEDELPPAPPPSLLFRLYQSSSDENRNLLCNFIESNPDALIASVRVNKRRRIAR